MESGRATLRNMRSKCRCSYVLQFAFRHAVSCVLHRPPSQVIHCTVLFHEWLCKLAGLSPPCKGLNEASFKVVRSHIPTRGWRARGKLEPRRRSSVGWPSPRARCAPLSLGHQTSTRATGEHGEHRGSDRAGHGVTAAADRLDRPRPPRAEKPESVCLFKKRPRLARHTLSR